MKIEVTNDLINFIRENQDLIAEGDFEELYQRAEKAAKVRTYELTNLFIESNIEFLHRLSRIPAHCFGYLPIESIIIPNNIHTIETGAFASSDLTSVEIPDSVTSSAEDTFEFCEKLQSAVLPSNWKEIPRFMFRSCVQLSSVQFPPNLEVVGQAAFYQCALTTLDLPESITLIDSNAFASIPATEVKLPTALTKLGIGAFAECHELQSVIFKANIKSIGEGAFSNCEKLANVTYAGTIEQWKKVKINKNNKQLFSLPIHCSDGDYAFDAVATAPRNVLKFIKDHAAEIQANDFDKIYLDAQNINKSFAIVSQITDFFYKSGVDPLQYLSYVPPYFLRGLEPVPAVLKNIVLSSKIKLIDISAFRYATGIESIVVPDSVEVINSSAFVYIRGLKTISLGKGLKKITGDAFLNTKADISYGGTIDQFKQIKITSKYPEGAWPFDKSVVLHCSDGDYTYQDFSQSVAEDFVRKNRKAIDSGNLNSVYARIANYDRQEFVRLVTQCLIKQGITPLEHLDMVPPYYFYQDPTTEITIPSNIKRIETNAFDSCPNLEKISLDSSLEDMHQYSITRDPALKTIQYNGTMDQWKQLAKKSHLSRYWDEWLDLTVECTDGSLKVNPSTRTDWIPVGGTI